MKVLITGVNGLLGQKLLNLFQYDSEVTLTATGLGENRNELGDYQYVSMDITSSRDVDAVMNVTAPDVVINTAAMTNVDQCETEPEACQELNIKAVQHLVKKCEHSQSFLLHFSTDFIFDGKNGPYKEDDDPNPLSQYAKSKLESETIIQQSSLHWAIVRTILVYGVVPNMSRSNIVLWVKKKLENGEPIRVVNDQWRNPTLVEDLAKACVGIAKNRLNGIFHISGKDMLTPFEMAMKTARFFKLDHSLIEEVDASVFTQSAKRPPRTGFIIEKAKKQLGFEPVSFEEGLGVIKNQLKND